MNLSGVSFFGLLYEILICSHMHEHKKGLLLMKKIVYFTNCPRKSGYYMKIKLPTFRAYSNFRVLTTLYYENFPLMHVKSI